MASISRTRKLDDLKTNLENEINSGLDRIDLFFEAYLDGPGSHEQKAAYIRKVVTSLTNEDEVIDLDGVVRVDTDKDKRIAELEAELEKAHSQHRMTLDDLNKSFKADGPAALGSGSTNLATEDDFPTSEEERELLILLRNNAAWMDNLIHILTTLPAIQRGALAVMMGELVRGRIKLLPNGISEAEQAAFDEIEQLKFELDSARKKLHARPSADDLIAANEAATQAQAEIDRLRQNRNDAIGVLRKLQAGLGGVETQLKTGLTVHLDLNKVSDAIDEIPTGLLGAKPEHLTNLRKAVGSIPREINNLTPEINKLHNLVGEVNTELAKYKTAR